MPPRKYPLPFKIEEMQPGVIYRDTKGFQYALSPCEICGKLRAVAVRHGKPKTARCSLCYNRSPEKREIMSMAHKGIPFKPEDVLRRAATLRNRYANEPEMRAKMSKINSEHIFTDEIRQRRSERLKGVKPSENCLVAQRKRIREIYDNPVLHLLWVKRLKEGRARVTPEAEAQRRYKIGKISKERWAIPEKRQEQVRRSRRASRQLPTKPEMLLDKLLSAYYPNEWSYNGKAEHIVVGGLVPDFINTQNRPLLIEMFGDYFHNPDKFKGMAYHRTENGRVKHYREHGYKCLVIWEHEMGHTDSVLIKIEEFINPEGVLSK